MPGARAWWARPAVHACLLAIVCLGVYANNFRHEYFLDDAYFLTSNLSLRSLANIPSFFTDPGTFATYRANVDYRPILSTTYAINYWMGGYDTTWWHATQILLHFFCALGLYALVRRVLRQIPAAADEPRVAILVPLIVALCFAVHPTASGVINYLSARSSLLTAAFLLPSIVLYMVPREDPRWARVPWVAALCYALAIFTKVEAIGVLGVYLMYEVWQTARAGEHRRHFFGDLLATANGQVLRRLSPFLAISVVYFTIRAKLMAPYEFELSRRAAGITNLDYFWTQTVVWWEYVGKWFAPVNLIADNGVHPIYRSPFEGPVPFAIIGWLVVAGALLATWRRRPWITMVAVAALALLSPTSSISPLAEMLNEHRPYLPVGILSMVWLIPAGTVLARATRRPPAVALSGVAALGLVLATFSVLTWQRNRAFSTDRAYLEDIVAKAPSGRALNNLGLVHMRQGDMRTAQGYFDRALEVAPDFYVIHINLAIVHRTLGDTARARWHLDRGVEFDRFSGSALTWRADFHLSQRDFVAARADLDAARPRSTDHYAICKGMATAFAGLGDVDQALREFRDCLRLDAPRAAADIVKIAKPFFDDPALTDAGLRFFEQLGTELPDTWWVHANIATLAAQRGDSVRSAAASALAARLRSESGR